MIVAGFWVLHSLGPLGPMNHMCEEFLYIFSFDLPRHNNNNDVLIHRIQAPLLAISEIRLVRDRWLRASGFA